jgi:putative sterol carrier protein
MNTKEFLEAIPAKVSPEAIEGMKARFHFDVEGEGAGKYTLNIEDGKVNVIEGLEGEADCSLKAKSEDLMAVVQGKQNAMMAVMTGKIKISNPGVLLKYAKLLGLG